MAAEPIYKLDKLNFDGPLDLLLVLIEKNKVDIYDIPIIEITEQYLDYVQGMEETDLDIISDFIVMAATLLDIKARMLLPEEEKAEEEEEDDPREELVARLLEYKRCKYMASVLRDMENAAGGVFYPSGGMDRELKHYEPPVDLDMLLSGLDAAMLKATYERLIKRMRAAVNERASGFGVIKKDRVSLVKCIEELRSYAKGHSRFYFRQMLGDKKGKTEIVVSFLAMLELMKLGKINADQREGGGDIELSVNKDADLDDIDLSEISDD